MEPYSTFTYLDGPLKGRTAPTLPAAKLDAIAARGVELHSVAFRAKGSELTERFEGFYRLERRDLPLLFVAIHIPDYVTPTTPATPAAIAKKEEPTPFRIEIFDDHPLAKRLAPIVAAMKANKEKSDVQG